MDHGQTIILIVMWAIAAILVRYLLFIRHGLIKLKRGIKQEGDHIEALIKEKEKAESIGTDLSAPDSSGAKTRDLDDRISRRKDSYNDLVENFNEQFQRIPHKYIAARLGYEPEKPFR